MPDPLIEIMTARWRQTESDISHRHAWPLMLIIMLLGAALRFYHLGFHQLWVDESFSAWASTFDPVDIIHICLQDIVHPPLYYFLLAFWTRVSGTSEFALRMLSASASLLGVPLLYQLGRRGWNRRTGLAASLFWAGSPFVIWYAQEVRMYALLTILGMASLLCLAYALFHGSWRWTVISAVLCLVGLYTHYFYIFIALSQVFYLILTWRRYRHAFRIWVLTSGLVVALYAPWGWAILRAGWQNAGINWIAPLSAETFVGALWQLGAGYHHLVDLPSTLVTIILGSGLVAEAVFGRSSQRSAIPGLAWTSLLTPILLVALISLRVPLFYSRFLQIVLPMYLLLAAAGLMRISQPAVGAALVVLVILLGNPVLREMYGSSTRYDQDWKLAMYDLANEAEARDAVAFRDNQSWYAYQYYYGGPLLTEINLPSGAGLDDLVAQIGDARRVWLVLWDAAQQCEIPLQFAPAVNSPIQLVDQKCYPQVLIVSYTWQGRMP